MRYFHSVLSFCPTLGGHVCWTADQHGHAADVCPRREAEEELCGGHPLSFANLQFTGSLVSHLKKGCCTQFKVLSVRKPVLTPPPRRFPFSPSIVWGSFPCIIGNVDGGDIHWLWVPWGSHPPEREKILPSPVAPLT